METLFGLDYPTLWFLVVGGLFSGYAILDGFDFGAGAWHLFFKKEKSRRLALNAIGPVWDGNEVWLVIGGGALFAGFPVMYATLLSGMYVPFMLFLLVIILRAVSIEFRSKEPMLWWRKMWDISYSVSSMLLPFFLGLVLGNVLLGMPIGEGYEYEGEGFLSFLNPYAVMVGISTLALMMSHGAIYLLLKTEGRMYANLKKGMIFFMVSFGITSLYTLIYIPHLSDTFRDSPVLFVVPLTVLLCIANVPRLASKKQFGKAFLFSSITISLLLIIVAIELYPNLLYSTLDPAHTITVYNAASSEKSLGIMLTFAAIGTPLVIGYTAFVYFTFRGKVRIDDTSY